MATSRKILFIGTIFPEPTSSAAGVRTLALIHDFLSRGDSIRFFSPSDANSFSQELSVLGVETAKIGPNDPVFDTLLREFGPDVVIFDRFMLEEQFGWRVAEHAPNALRILDTIDLHFLRRIRAEWLTEALRREKVQEGGPVPDADLQKLAFQRSGIETPDCDRELASIYRSDLTLILSTFEEELLEEQFQIPKELLLGLGFSYAVKHSPPARAACRNFVSIGNFRHAPNRDSAFWLARVLWPKIRGQLADLGDHEAELHLYGAYPPKEIMALDRPKDRIRVFGPADDAVATLGNYRILLAPIRFGAGIKGKVADAWATGVPVVTTALGAEGMVPRGLSSESFAGWVENTEAGYCERAASAYLDPAARLEKGIQGRAALSGLYGLETNRKKFLARIDLLLGASGLTGTLSEVRSGNRFGRILRNEYHGRTKYLAKWIEEKNRKTES